MGKGKTKQKAALRVLNGNSAKSRDVEKPKPEISIDPKFLRQASSKKASKAISSSFQQQVLSLQERNYRFSTTIRSKKGVNSSNNPTSNSLTHIQLAPATFILPSKPEEKYFTETDALFMTESTSVSTRSHSNEALYKLPSKKENDVLENNPYKGLDEEDETDTRVRIAPPTFSFSGSISTSKNSEDDDI